MSRKKKISKQEFALIKSLLEAGVKNVDIVKITGRSSGSISRVKKYECVEDLCDSQKGKKTKVDSLASPKNSFINAINALIHKISKNTEAVVELNKNIKSKKKWF